MFRIDYKKTNKQLETGLNYIFQNVENKMK